jgi:hypothetical protein
VSYAHGHTGCGAEERLLAARSLIQITMTVKDEMVPTPEAPYPHITDEVETIELVDRLGYEVCGELYPTVKSLPPAEARAVVEAAVGL